MEYYPTDRGASSSHSGSHPNSHSVSHHSGLGPIPRQPRQPRQSSSARRRPIDPSMHLQLRDDDKDRVQIPPASPRVISSLITSLSVISQPAGRHFDDPSLSIPSPVSPTDGSFGVEYGAYMHALERLQEEDDINELAASPPVIRTSKPPSRLLTYYRPQVPAAATPPTASSLCCGTPRGPPPRGPHHRHPKIPPASATCPSNGVFSAPPDSRKPLTQESWGAKLGRGHKGLMYMTSRERLRSGDSEKKRNGAGGLGLGLGLGSKSSSFSNLSVRPDPILAETTISEEPTNMVDAYELTTDPIPPTDSTHVLHPVPVRDSSLRGTKHKTRRSSRRSSKQRSEEAKTEPTPEEQLFADPPDRRPHQSTFDTETKTRQDDILRDMMDLPRDSGTSMGVVQDPNCTYEGAGTGETLEAPGIDDGAPSPAISQSKRLSGQSADRKKSGRVTPDPTDMLKSKRSSSRLNRLSANPKTPRPADDVKEEATPDAVVGYGRPGSADSVDDDVEAYLCSPRLSQKIRHPQTGRVISFSEVGDPEGSAVFCCVGMGLTRYITAFYDELALALKLRLITPDRPGVGDSEAYDGNTTPLSWPDDVYAICQTLKVTKFSILAHSAGAIYALATALRMPQHIRGRIHLLAPWIPPSQMNVFGTTQALPPTNAIPTSQKILRALPTPFLKAANSSFMTATSSSITSSLPKNSPRRGKRKSAATPGRETGASHKHDVVSGMDKENILHDGGAEASTPGQAAPSDRPRMMSHATNPHDSMMTPASDALADKERQMTYDTRLTHAIWDLATTGANPAVDLLVCLERRHTIGFRYVDITRPVVIHHGSKDTRVPVDNVRWLGKAMRRCEVRVLEDEGHGLMASASVMGTVLMEISKEWEDWTRLTNPTRTEERGRSTLVAAR